MYKKGMSVYIKNETDNDLKLSVTYFNTIIN